MKVMTIVGTRPEIIRLSQVVRALQQTTDHVLVHTGQNWDPRLSDVFFSELRTGSPQHWLEVPVGSLGVVLGGVLERIDRVLGEEAPDAVVILGDTNSCLGAIVAKRRGIPVFHLEAGNRCFDDNVPEETNRRIIDHTADYNLCYTEHARRNLIAEGLSPRRTFVVGSPMREVLDSARADIDASNALDDLGLTPGAYFLVSTHREENIDVGHHLTQLLDTLDRLGERGMPVIVSTHPRLRQRLDERRAESEHDIRFLPPFGYLAYNKLQKHAACVLSDSGTITEESAIVGFPAVSMRQAIERPEGLDTGAIVLSGLEPDAVVRCVDMVMSQHASGVRPRAPEEYDIPDVSRRVSRLVVGLTPLHRRWLGLDEKAPRTEGRR